MRLLVLHVSVVGTPTQALLCVLSVHPENSHLLWDSPLACHAVQVHIPPAGHLIVSFVQRKKRSRPSSRILVQLYNDHSNCIAQLRKHWFTHRYLKSHSSRDTLCHQIAYNELAYNELYFTIYRYATGGVVCKS